MIICNPERTEPLINKLLLLWEKSVRKSHLFLTDAKIIDLIPFVKAALYEIQHLILAKNENENENENEIMGFMGIAGDKIEMLFLAPEYFAKGVGKELVNIALNKYHVAKVDVNEQNPDAIGFYKHLGFEVFDRIERDAQGEPFPILEMMMNYDESTFLNP